jgi:hypothetical protein
MDKTKKLGLFIVILGFILLIVLIYFSFFRNSTVEEPVIIESPEEPEIGLPTTTEPSITPGDVPRNYQTYDVDKEEPHTASLADATKISMIFTERLGSFSSHSTFSNVVDAKLFMTSSMKDWADSYIIRLKKEYPSDVFYRISTYALSAEVIDYNENEASIKVVAHRTEELELGQENIFIQNMLVDLILENNQWKVEAAYWQDL